MNRPAQNPLIAVVVLALLAISLGEVQAASIESLISPGELSAAHADLQEDCGACHVAFDRDGERALCLDCHEEIAGDIAQQRKFHGMHATIPAGPCRDCHREHGGPGSDITGLVPETFDHHLTAFRLAGKHSSLSCTQCHDEQTPYRETTGQCVQCHESDDHHKGGLGENCGSCHSASGWQEVDFDHEEASEMTLVGAHARQACSSCHIDNVFSDTPTQCIDCHRVDDVHDGNRGTECGSCHTESNWQETAFDHTGETGFVLAGVHADLSCGACHLQDMSLSKPPETCVGCHSSDDVHAGSGGTQCGDCHSNETWRLEFDHFAETQFALAGAHADLQCGACHLDGMDESLPVDCESCHESDDPHAGTLGSCDDCHAESAWRTPLRFDHEFTAFPLVGMHALATCDQCHETRQFNETDETCADCHEQDDHHEGVFGRDCTGCHNPGGWELWQFDHDSQTTFVLDGAHSDLFCASCHAPRSGLAENQSGECITCHRGDDAHGGSFGSDCGDCHTTIDFGDDVRFR